MYISMNNNFYDIATAMYNHNNKIIVPSGKNESGNEPVNNKRVVIATAAHIFFSRGMLLSDDLVRGLLESDMSSEELSAYLNHMIKVSDETYGYRLYKPFYRNFPKEVMEAREADLIINAILHYISGGTIVPETNVAQAVYGPIAGSVRINPEDVRIIRSASINDFFAIAKNLMISNTSISASDKQILRLAISTDQSIIPEDIPHKENKAIVIATMLNANILDHRLYMNISNPTDILRIASALSDGDVSLHSPTRFVSFPRSIRKWIMDMMECMPGVMEEEMLKYRERWIRIGERIHPNSFSSDEYERVIDAFDVIRNNEKVIVSFASKVERAYLEKKFDTLLELLSTKPGYFARELHHMLKTFPDKHYMIAVKFASIVSNVSTPVLFQVKAYYKNKLFEQNTGVYFPKGNTQKIFVRTNCDTVKINDTIVDLIVLACEHGITTQLCERYQSEYDDEKKVYIDPSLMNYLIPFSQRSASKSLRVVPRGSKMTMSDDKYIRPFIHWMNNDSRIDVDLSIAFLDNNYTLIDTISYSELRNQYAAHSGDYTNAPSPDGACEFVDINSVKALEHGARYAALMVHSYTQDPFRDIPECFVGYMTIEEDEYQANYNSNQNHYNIKNVRMKMDIGNDAQYVMVCAFDLEERVVYWCDVAGMAEQKIYVPNNVDQTQHVISFMLQSIVESKRENMFELARATSIAKGHSFVDNVKDANITYTVEPLEIEGKQNISAFDSDIWQAMV